MNQPSESLCTVEEWSVPARPPGIELKHLLIPLKWTNTHRHRPDGDLAFAGPLLLLLVMDWLVDLSDLKAGTDAGL